MKTLERSRLDAVLHLERGAVWARYTAFIVLAPLYFSEPRDDERVRNLAIIAAALVLHHAFVQVILWTRRHHLFQSPLNLVVYLAEASAVAGVMDPKASAFYFVFLLVIIGAGLHTTRTWALVGTAAATIAAYGAVLAVRWKFQNDTITLSLAGTRMVGIGLCAWAVATVGRLLREREAQAGNSVRELAATRAALDAVFAIAAGPVFLYGEDLLIADANDAACTFAGLSHDEIVGRAVYAIACNEAAQVDRASRAWLTKEFHGERACVDGGGRPCILECRVQVFEDGERRLCALAATDVTERRRVLESAQEASADLARANRELRQGRELAAERSAATACRAISPLTAARGYLDMLLCEELGALTLEQRKALRVCRRGIEQVCRLMEEALDPRAVPAENLSDPENSETS